jgi:transcriptional regulator with XRE-family HTH domain
MPISPTTPRFADVLRRYRRNAGISQRELARRAGYSADYVSMLERGVRLPGTGTLRPLLEALELGDAEREDLLHAIWSSRSSAPVFKPPTLASASTLIQRDAELAEIEFFLNGKHPALLVVGEAGIGKTRLLEATRQLALERGMTTLTSGSRSHLTQPARANAPIREALSDFVYAQPRRVLRNVLQGCEALARLLPEVAELGGSVPDLHLPPEHERRQIFHAVARFLAHSAGPAGCLLVLDELQSARADAIELLGFLLSTLVGAYRPGEVLPGHPLSALLDTLLHRDDITVVHPQPLEPELARQVIVNALPAGHESDARVDAAVSLADGVPLYLVCFARALREQIMAESHTPARDRFAFASRLPDDLVVLVRNQIERLPEISQDLLRALAQSPRGRLTGAQLVECLAQDRAKVRAGLSQLMRSHVLREVDEDVFEIAREVIRLVAAAH